MYSWH